MNPPPPPPAEGGEGIRFLSFGSYPCFFGGGGRGEGERMRERGVKGYQGVHHMTCVVTVTLQTQRLAQAIVRAREKRV